MSRYNDKGITLISLIIIVVVILILASVTVSGTLMQMDNTELKAFYSKLEVAQEAVEKISSTNESYQDAGGNTILLKELGSSPSQEQISLLEELHLDSESFKYFTSQEVEEQLSIHGIDFDLLIDFNNRVVVSPQGIEAKGKKYYTLPEIKNKVNANTTKNVGTIDFTYTVQTYGASNYKLIIKPVNIGDVATGIVKYKKQDKTYWSIAYNNEVIIEDLNSLYEITYEDANGNSTTKSIKLSLDANNQVQVIEVAMEE